MTEYEADGTLKLDEAVSLPDVLDTLIVGGGPAGTAAAFRAKELGLQALVIDFDDLLKRIRDYPKDKLILPNFGGGDSMQFPAGGECVASLHFDPIDKDDMCTTWKGYYRAFSVPAKVGVELTGLERSGDVWNATAWNHRTREQEEYRTRSVVLALGRGVPRRFDIPGNTDGIQYRLDDPAKMGGPVCVIGGGTSAAEAVIGISAAKVEAEDESPVYWSYRGSKMPRVSKALADVFFEAYFINGNIRYFPNSEPVAVVTSPDRSENLSILVDRKPTPERACESVHLEFPKSSCIACIGEDIPEAFLREVGIEMVSWGGKSDGKSKKMMALTRLLESQQPDIYVIGDLLSQAYLETEDFDAPTDSYRQVKHRGNVKSSLRDGVFVAEVIKQRLDGRAREEVDVAIEDAAAEPVADAEALDLGSEPEEAVGDESPSKIASLVQITPAGVEAEEFTLKASGTTTIGRQGCDINFPQDTLLAENHASVAFRDGDYFLRDDGSRSGTYLRVRPGHPVSLADKDLVRMGRQILVVHEDEEGMYVQHYDAGGQPKGRHALDEGTTIFGRVAADAGNSVVLDPDDLTLSRLHMAIMRKGAALTLEDRSRNGTYVKISVERRLEHGDLFRVGNQQMEVRWTARELPQKQGSAPVESAPAPSVTFADQDIGGPIDPEQSLVAWAEQNDVDLDASCWMGMCGVDPIRVLEGAEYLNEPDEQECKTLKNKGLEPGACRLACMTKASGPVIVEVVK